MLLEGRCVSCSTRDAKVHDGARVTLDCASADARQAVARYGRWATPEVRWDEKTRAANFGKGDLPHGKVGTVRR